MSERNSLVAVLETHVAAEQAVQELHRSGFDMKKLSLVGKGSHEKDVVGTYSVGDRMLYWGLNGAFWGGMLAALYGSAFFIIPGIGPLMAVGPVAVWVLGVVEGAVAVGGLSVVGAALYGAGISKDSVQQYEAELRAGKFLLIAHGTPGEVSHAKKVVDQTGVGSSTLHLEPPIAGNVRS